MYTTINSLPAGVVKLVDTIDSKSVEATPLVRVRRKEGCFKRNNPHYGNL